jgi:arabinan endo-1,5-alpha-L-arabinosidase
MTSDKLHRLRPFLSILAVHVVCVPAAALHLTGSVNIHDPSRILKEGDRYYVFATGSSFSPINMKYSDNLTLWLSGPNGAVFENIPEWAYDEVTDNGENDIPDNMWAPSVIHFNNEYRMYYSVSTFGSQNSVIGLATNSTLDFNDPNYEWVDHELVIESENSSSYDYNAIDAGVFYDEDDERMWMTWGSFWDGIFVTELDPDTGKRITPDSAIINIADRSQGSQIEAPYLMKRDGYYYLFVNWGRCCLGTGSTYNIRVGRGTSPTGPFLDESGDEMIDGGGDLFLGTEDNFIGPGHFSYFTEEGVEYFGYHYYDGNAGGTSKYSIRELTWTEDGWPEVVPETPLPPVPPPGDYNGNFVVDAADYTVWRDTLGSTTDLRANGLNFGPSAGVIDQLDYLVWKNNFGKSALVGSGATSGAASPEAIPEPSSFGFAAIAALTAAILDWRRAPTTRKR